MSQPPIVPSGTRVRFASSVKAARQKLPTRPVLLKHNLALYNIDNNRKDPYCGYMNGNSDIMGVATELTNLTRMVGRRSLHLISLAT